MNLLLISFLLGEKKFWMLSLLEKLQNGTCLSRKLSWARSLNTWAKSLLVLNTHMKFHSLRKPAEKASGALLLEEECPSNVSHFGHFSSAIFFTGDMPLNSLVSEAFVHFFVEIVGHYSLHMNVTEKGERVFQREPFRKSHTSRNVRHFLHFFMETQMFAGFIQDRELSKSAVKGEAFLFYKLTSTSHIFNSYKAFCPSKFSCWHM